MSLQMGMLLVVLSLPVIVMTVAHAYAMFAQEATHAYVVVLDQVASAKEIAANHAKQHKIRVIHVYDSSVKAYVGIIRTSRLEALRQEGQVRAIYLRDAAEKEEMDMIDRTLA